MNKTSDEILVKSMYILANDVQTDDGVANAAIYEAANRLKELTNCWFDPNEETPNEEVSLDIVIENVLGGSTAIKGYYYGGKFIDRTFVPVADVGAWAYARELPEWL